MIKASRRQWEVIDLVCKEHGVKPDDLSNRQDRITNRAKFVVVRIFRLAGLSYPQIGRILGKDHTSVMNADKKIDNHPDLVEQSLKYWIDIYRKSGDGDNFLIAEITYKKNKELMAIKELFNKGKKINDIAKELNLLEDYVSEKIIFLDNVCQKKKVPNYQKGDYRFIYV